MSQGTIDHRLSIILVCRQCGTEWVPPDRGSNGHFLDSGEYKTTMLIDPKGARCPVCNAVENMFSEFKRLQSRERNYFPGPMPAPRFIPEPGPTPEQEFAKFANYSEPESDS